MRSVLAGFAFFAATTIAAAQLVPPPPPPPGGGSVGAIGNTGGSSGAVLADIIIGVTALIVAKDLGAKMRGSKPWAQPREEEWFAQADGNPR